MFKTRLPLFTTVSACAVPPIKRVIDAATSNFFILVIIYHLFLNAFHKKQRSLSAYVKRAWGNKRFIVFTYKRTWVQVINNAISMPRYLVARVCQ